MSLASLKPLAQCSWLISKISVDSNLFELCLTSGSTCPYRDSNILLACKFSQTQRMAIALILIP